jgi:hypothetical protein
MHKKNWKILFTIGVNHIAWLKFVNERNTVKDQSLWPFFIGLVDHNPSSLFYFGKTLLFFSFDLHFQFVLHLFLYLF